MSDCSIPIRILRHRRTRLEPPSGFCLGVGMRTLSFAKGHGTGNDFVILRDRHNTSPISAEDVRLLCDRHFGLGADGVLRAVKAAHVPDWEGDPELWFMDYRNADGSIAEMCGNGLRVFARYLVDEGLMSSVAQVATRAGMRATTTHPDRVSVEVGTPSVLGQVQVELAGTQYQATKVDVGNPHAVVLLPEGTDLAALPVVEQPRWSEQDYPEGVNVEFVVPSGARELSLRVHERGSGETLSCGTGIVASVAAWSQRQDLAGGTFTVTIPGGRVTVELSGDSAVLTGPAVVVARGTVSLPDWQH